eukprot:4580412-Amphidinium_carterae.1
MTCDIESLYPHTQLLPAARCTRRRRIEAKFSVLVSWALCRLLETILKSQYVDFNQSIWHITEGIPTGSP